MVSPQPAYAWLRTVSEAEVIVVIPVGTANEWRRSKGAAPERANAPSGAPSDWLVLLQLPLLTLAETACVASVDRLGRTVAPL